MLLTHAASFYLFRQQTSKIKLSWVIRPFAFVCIHTMYVRTAAIQKYQYRFRHYINASIYSTYVGRIPSGKLRSQYTVTFSSIDKISGRSPFMYVNVQICLFNSFPVFTRIFQPLNIIISQCLWHININIFYIISQCSWYAKT